MRRDVSGARATPTTSASTASAHREGARLGRREIAWILGTRAVVSALVLALGFHAVSDDDFSRVVIAQQLALSPKLDPSGTSWLPFPFWITGGAMALFGRDLWVARAVALGLGAAASWLVAECARRLTSDLRAAVIAGCASALVGWGAWLGVATVPELFTAAATLFAATTLASRSPRDRALGALALGIATLSRYEPWPVAAAWAVWNTAYPARGPRERPSSHARARALAISALAVLGPAAWIAWNRAAHGDAFHFVARVTAYRRALGDATNESTLARLAAYPGAMVRELPEIMVAAIVVAVFALRPASRRTTLDALRGLTPLFALAAVQILALSLALVKDGAPTHHPERAALFPALALTVACAAALAPSTAPARSSARAAFAVTAAALLVRAAIMPAVARHNGPSAPGLGPHLVRLVTPREAFIDRTAEVTIGALAARSAPAGSKIFIAGVDDYGYFAILAGSARPESFILERDPDPRKRAAAEPRPPLLEAISKSGARHVISRDVPREPSLVSPSFGWVQVAAAGPYSLQIAADEDHRAPDPTTP